MATMVKSRWSRDGNHGRLSSVWMVAMCDFLFLICKIDGCQECNFCEFWLDFFARIVGRLIRSNFCGFYGYHKCSPSVEWGSFMATMS